MRKRDQYKKPKPLSKLPTLIIMIFTLCVIIFFGRDISSKIAALFEPNVAVSDNPEPPQPIDMPAAPAAAPRLTGSVVHHANTDAAQSLLPVISRGTTK